MMTMMNRRLAWILPRGKILPPKHNSYSRLHQVMRMQVRMVSLRIGACSNCRSSTKEVMICQHKRRTSSTLPCCPIAWRRLSVSEWPSWGGPKRRRSPILSSKTWTFKSWWRMVKSWISPTARIASILVGHRLEDRVVTQTHWSMAAAKWFTITLASAPLCKHCKTM